MPEVELFKSTSAELFSTALAPLKCGNKELKLSIDFAENIATTKIATTENAELVAGATTEVYKEALKIMEAVATKLNRPILYLFSTDNLKLQAWAKDSEKGLGIFNWDEIDEEAGFLSARKLILPDAQAHVA